MFNRVIVAVVGSSNSGKTTAVEAIIKGLTKKGYKVASAKRIPEPEFTIDTEGKDTWRHAKAGASIVLSVAPNELTTINKCETKNITLEQLISHIPDDAEVIIIEGFKALVAEEMNIPKIVATKTTTEISEAISKYKNIIAFIGQAPNKKMQTEIPFVDTIKEPEKLFKLLNDKIAVQIERKHKREQKITIKINEQTLPMGDFVQDIIRNSVLAMVASLKGVTIKGEEKVSIVIKQLKRD